MSTKRKISQSPIYQGSDEIIAYTIDFSNWGTPSSPTVTIIEKLSGLNVSSTKLSGAASVAGDVVTTPTVKNLVAGTEYVLKCVVTVSGNKLSAYCEIRCDVA